MQLLRRYLAWQVEIVAALAMRVSAALETSHLLAALDCDPEFALESDRGDSSALLAIFGSKP
jgi:hypothetical protein